MAVFALMGAAFLFVNNITAGIASLAVSAVMLAVSEAICRGKTANGILNRLYYSGTLPMFGLAVIFICIGTAAYFILGAGWVVIGIIYLKKYDKARSETNTDTRSE